MKSVRTHFADLIKERGFTPEDLQKYREISHLVDVAAARVERDSPSSCNGADCPGLADHCGLGDCGYDEGGCGSDECCNYCDSCMALWDTCTSSEPCIRADDPL